MKTYIKDSLTNQFYCVEQTEMVNGELTAGPNDFPFWSEDISKACDFGSELLARHEMQMNDLTCDGTRNPVILPVNNFAETTIVAFHIGRGGHFHNAGHLTFVDQKGIRSFTNDLYTWYENLHKFSDRFGFEQTGSKEQRCIVDLVTDEAFDELEEKFGIKKEMLGEEIYRDCNGSDVGLTVKEANAGVGRIEIDGQYNTTYAKYLSECTDNELQLIAEYNGYVDSNIRDYAKEQLGIVDDEETED